MFHWIVLRVLAGKPGGEYAAGGVVTIRVKRQGSMKMELWARMAGMATLTTMFGGIAVAQEPVAPKASAALTQEASKDGTTVALTLKHAIELALQNSKEIQVAKIQASVADRAAEIPSRSSCRICMRAPVRGIPTGYRKRRG